MSQVASEVKAPPLPNMRHANRPADKVGTESHFAALLDSATANDRAPAPSRPERTAPSQESRKSETPDDQPPAEAAPAEDDTVPSAPVQTATESGEPSETTGETVDPATTDTTVDTTSQTEEVLAAIPAPDTVQTPSQVQASVAVATVVPVVAAPAIAPVAPTGDMPSENTDAALPAIKAAAPSGAPAEEIAATPAQAESDDVETAKPEAGTDKPVKADAKTDAKADVPSANNAASPETSEQDKTDMQPPRDAAARSEPHQAKSGTEISPQPDSAAPKQDKADGTDIQPASKTQPAVATNDGPSNFPLTQLHAHSNTSATTATAQNAAQIANAVPVNGVAVEIAAQMKAGAHRFEIRLDPPELGRIDVRLEVDKNGQVTSHLRVDRVETLDMLRRDSANLERALQDAGLKTSDNALNFSLRDQSLRQQAHDQGTQNAAQYVATDESMPEIAGVQSAAWASRPGGIDIRV